MLLDQHFAGCSSSPDIGDLIQALCLAQAQYKPVARSARYDLGNKSYRYSTWADLCDAIYPALHKQGLIFLPRKTFTANGWVMVGTLAHGKSGQWITSTCPIRDVVDGYGTRSDSQSFEIGVTYAKKTLFLSMAGGWAVGDEQQEQESAAAPAADPEVAADQAKREAIRMKVEMGLEQFASNPAKTKALFARMDEMVQAGELSSEDSASLKKKYEPKPSTKKEVAVAN
jgi:hypothetical protein